jgi:hypothetical protein
MSDAVREAAASPSPSAAPYPGSSPPPMAPQELHRYLVRIHRQRNRLDYPGVREPSSPRSCRHLRALMP